MLKCAKIEIKPPLSHNSEFYNYSSLLEMASIATFKTLHYSWYFTLHPKIVRMEDLIK